MVRTLIHFGWLVGAYVALSLAVRILPVVSKRIRRFSVRRRARRSPPSLRFTLLVRIGEGCEEIHPSVQLRGEPLRANGTIRLTLVDERGMIRFALSREVPAEVVGAELPLPSFSPPLGATLEDVLSWRWDLVVEPKGRRPVTSSHHLVSAGGIDREAEIGSRPL